ncbi:hypothetical protein [Streptomyces justiciae]|uniref:Uncharacterized protein n=1 Tax=Streptomyces justiciae TaxID=2780140 RepID=A0ABU3LWE1_9ACTN|nr:hypothetical protein [Streptomyces justiciae]MDT7843398.1 hypothetical protein [Streptomyces justiciae]
MASARPRTALRTRTAPGASPPRSAPTVPQAHLFSAVRRHDSLTATAREVGAHPNEFPEFQPLIATVADEELRDAVATPNALHARHRSANTARARRAHPDPAAVLVLHASRDRTGNPTTTPRP